MTAAVMEDFRVTSDKLEEWKEVLPRAGPKYRLGMYFDTIHEIPEFDAVIDPEGGYQSTWETETDLQTDCDDYGSFIFSNIDGDSASVVCLQEDEAADLIERFNLKHSSPGSTSPQRQQAVVGDITLSSFASPSSSRPNQPEVTYDRVDGDDEHVYESIDDCVEEYQLFLYNEEGSPPLNNTPTHARITTKVKQHSGIKSKRSSSLPNPQTETLGYFSNKHHHSSHRKYSDVSDYAKLAKKRSEPNPPPLPPPNHHLPSSESHYSQLYNRLSSATFPSPSKEPKRSSSQQPVAVLKHKGKEYMLPLGDNKPRRHSASSASPKHANAHIHPSPSSSSHLSNFYTTITTPTHHAKTDPKESLSPVGGKKKSKHSSSTYTNQTSCASTNNLSKSHVTLYGVL